MIKLLEMIVFNFKILYYDIDFLNKKSLHLLLSQFDLINSNDIENKRYLINLITINEKLKDKVIHNQEPNI